MDNGFPPLALLDASFLIFLALGTYVIHVLLNLGVSGFLFLFVEIPEPPFCFLFERSRVLIFWIVRLWLLDFFLGLDWCD